MNLLDLTESDNIDDRRGDEAPVGLLKLLGLPEDDLKKLMMLAKGFNSTQGRWSNHLAPETYDLDMMKSVLGQNMSSRDLDPYNAVKQPFSSVLRMY